MGDKRIPVSFRVSTRFKRCLALAAQREQRSQTNFLEWLLLDYCQKAGLVDLSEAALARPDAAKKKGQE